MSNKILLPAVFIFAGWSSGAFAEFSIQDLHTASALAVDELGKQSPEHVNHVSGYKTWKSGQDAKVKLYVTHDGMNMEFNFLCHRHGNSIECHSQ